MFFNTNTIINIRLLFLLIANFSILEWDAFFARFLLAIGVLMYVPFIKMVDNQYLAEEKAALEKEEDDNLSFDDLEL